MQASELRFEEGLSLFVEPDLNVGMTQESHILKAVFRTSWDLEIRSHHRTHCTNEKPWRTVFSFDLYFSIVEHELLRTSTTIPMRRLVLLVRSLRGH